MTTPKLDSLFVAELRKAGFNDQQIKVILSIMDSVCLECWDYENPCYCAPCYDE